MSLAADLAARVAAGDHQAVGPEDLATLVLSVPREALTREFLLAAFDVMEWRGYWRAVQETQASIEALGATSQ